MCFLIAHVFARGIDCFAVRHLMRGYIWPSNHCRRPSVIAIASAFIFALLKSPRNRNRFNLMSRSEKLMYIILVYYSCETRSSRTTWISSPVRGIWIGAITVFYTHHGLGFSSRETTSECRFLLSQISRRSTENFTLTSVVFAVSSVAGPVSTVNSPRFSIASVVIVIAWEIWDSALESNRRFMCSEVTATHLNMKRDEWAEDLNSIANNSSWTYAYVMGWPRV